MVRAIETNFVLIRGYKKGSDLQYLQSQSEVMKTAKNPQTTEKKHSQGKFA